MIYSTLYADLLFAYTFTLPLYQRKKLYYIFGLSKSHCHCLYLSVCLFAILSVNFTLLFTITHHRFQLEKLICTKHASWYILSFCINKDGHWQWPARSFLLFWLRILTHSVFQCNNSSQIWATIAKFARNFHPGILPTGIENGSHWLWPSKSFGHFASEFQETPFNIARAYFLLLGKRNCMSQTFSFLFLIHHRFFNIKM